jgi:predicted enzyme related to lactoylglutathione lyase
MYLVGAQRRQAEAYMTYPHGMITWTDLSSPDVPAARDFYSVLMGWEAAPVQG